MLQPSQRPRSSPPPAALARSVDLDVTDVDLIREVVAAVDAETPLGTVVANAGVAFARPLADVEPAEYDRLMAVNVRGVFFVVQAAVRAMTPRGCGSIVTVCSTSGFTASTGPMTVVRRLEGRGAAADAGGRKGGRPARPACQRGRAGHGRDGPDPRPRLTRRARRARCERAFRSAASGRPAEIAAAVTFLSSRDASYVTGHVLVVDGGWLA